MSENSTETGMDSKVFLTSPNEHRALQFEVQIPEKGSALSVAEDLKGAVEIANANRKTNPKAWYGLSLEVDILTKAVSNVAERKIEDANLSKPIEPKVRAEYERGVTALEASDEVEKILDPMEEKLTKDSQATTTEYNDWLYPSFQDKDYQVPLSPLVRAGRSLKSLLDREATRA